MDWGRGFYKFNVVYFFYVDAMNNKLDSLFSLRENFTDKSVWWDFVKMKISGFSISYSSFKAKESRYKEQKIANELSINQSVVQVLNLHINGF